MIIEAFERGWPICPHCKKEVRDWTDYTPDEGVDIEVEECENCGKPFTFSLSISYSFTSKAVTQ